MTATGATVLVTGAHGAIGSHVSASLAAAGDAVSGVALVRTGSPTGLASGLRSVAADLREPDAIAKVIAAERPRVVVHLAGLTGAACETDPVSARLVNVESSRAIAAALLDLDGPRTLVFASSAAVYGVGYDGPIPESAERRGASVYGLTKIAAEDALREMSAPGRLETVALRIFNVFGPGLHSSLVNRLADATASSPLRMAGGTGVLRDYVHVRDVVRAIDAAGRLAVPDGFIAVNVGTGVGTSAQHLVDLVARSREVHVAWASEGESAQSTNSSVADVGLAARVLGFTPAPLSETFDPHEHPRTPA